MKDFFNRLYQIALSMGKARAASSLARQGNHEAARRLMVE
jgi:hypothetical protein